MALNTMPVASRAEITARASIVRMSALSLMPGDGALQPMQHLIDRHGLDRDRVEAEPEN
jgi:hypothetical protein